MACGVKKGGVIEKGMGRTGKQDIGKTEMILGYRFHYR